MEQTIPQLVRGAAQRMGSRTAIEEGSTRLSFEDLARVSLQAARAFMAAGIESGDRVALWAPNLSEWIVAALGAQSAGGVLVPLNTRMKGSEAAYVLRTSGARILCTMGEFLGFNYVDSLGDQELPKLEKVVVLKDSAPDAVTWSEFLTSGNAISEALALERIESVGPEDLSDLLFTSGTTGHPKGVMTRHQISPP